MTYRKLTAGQVREINALEETTEAPLNFETQLKVGQRFEVQTAKALRKAGIDFKAATRAQQFKGFDFITDDGYKIECKLDTYCSKNGNLFIELTQGKQNGSQGLGCIFTSTADIILFSTGVKVYAFSPLFLRTWFALKSPTLTLKSVSTNSTGVLYPVDDSLDSFCALGDLADFLTELVGG